MMLALTVAIRCWYMAFRAGRVGTKCGAFKFQAKVERGAVVVVAVIGGLGVVEGPGADCWSGYESQHSFFVTVS